MDGAKAQTASRNSLAGALANAGGNFGGIAGTARYHGAMSTITEPETVQVPREPTEAMLTAAAGVGDEPDYLAAVWRAMVDAATDEKPNIG